MPLPIDNLTTAFLDAATDDPSQARVELLAAVNKIKELIAVLDDGTGGGLNADMLDGFHAAATPAINVIPVHDANGNIRLGRVIGVGTVPDTNHDPASIAVQEFGDWGIIHARSDNAFDIISNAKYVAGSYVYRNTGVATLMHFHMSGSITFYTAVSGTAGSAVLWVPRLTIPVTVGQPLTYEGNNVRHNGNIFHGRVNGDGAVFRLPSGWSAVRNGVGIYTITHNLGNANYSVTAMCFSFADVFITISQINANSFVLRSYNSAGATADSAFIFSMLLD